MPAWTLLFNSEVRRARRHLRRVAEANPVFAIGLLLGVFASLWLSWDAGRQTGALVATIPGAVTIEGAAIMAISGILAALVTSSAPGLERFDEQLQAAPLARWESYAGLVAVPCTIVWLLSSIYGAAFGFGMMAGASLSSPALGALQIMAGGVGVASIIAAITAVVRRRRFSRALAVSMCLLLIAISLPVVAARLGGSTYPLTWLAAFLPDPGNSYSSPITVAALTVAVPTLAYMGWLMIESDPQRIRDSGTHMSVPIPRNLPAGLTISHVLAGLRVRSVREGFIAALAIATLGSLVFRVLFGGDAPRFSPFMSILAVMLAATVACSSTGDILRPDWLWATSRRSRALLGAAWWLSVGLGSAILVAIVVAPGLLFLGGDGLRIAVLLGILASSLVGPVTKLLPWDHDSLSSQVVASFALLLLLGGSMEAVAWTADRISQTAALLTLFGIAMSALGVTIYAWRKSP